MSQPRKRANLETCTTYMKDTLIILKDAYDRGESFVYLPDVHPLTVRALTKRDWIVKSIAPKGLDAVRYAITTRGINALKIYEIPTEEYDQRRYDGVCPRCCVRKKYIYNKSGNTAPYCRECESEIGKRKRQLFNGYDKPGICPDCSVRARHISKSGKIRTYCLVCRRKRSKYSRKRQNQSLVQRVKNGEVLLCYRCHEKPRQLTKNTLQDYCRDCANKHRRDSRRIINS